VTSEQPPAASPGKGQGRRVLVAIVVVLALGGVAALFLARPAGEPDSGGAKGAGSPAAAESPFAAWKRLREAFLTAPPPRIACEIVEQDGSSSWSTTAEIVIVGDGAIVTKRNGGADAGVYEATFSTKRVVYSVGDPKEVALVEPLGTWILPTWLDYGMGGVLAATFDDRPHVESRLRSPAQGIGPFVPQSVRSDAAGATVVDGVIVSPRRRIDVSITFGSDGRPTRRSLRDPTPPKLTSSLERYTYGVAPPR